MKASSSSRVQVVARCRPHNEIEAAHGGVVAVGFPDSSESMMEVKDETGKSQSFTFDRVFGMDSTQEEVFQHVGVPLVDAVFEGFNGTVFAYGQTSSGKTYTMLGPSISDNTAGIIPRVADRIFTLIAKADEAIEFTVKASFVEIYLERIRDLLDPKRTNLMVREEKKKGIYVEGMTERYVSSVREMMEMMFSGMENRKTSATAMNEGSSRSHSVFIINVTQKDERSGSSKASRINLVDLAGSETVKKTGATGAQLEEAKMINLSLSSLGNVIMALTDPKASHVPYRDSKLTRMLQESLGGNARTWLVINVSPSSYNASETLSTLRFGYRAKSIKNKAVVNQVRSAEELEALLEIAEKRIEQLLRNNSAGDAADEGSREKLETDFFAKEAMVLQLDARVNELEIQHYQDAEERRRLEGDIELLLADLRKSQKSLEQSELQIQDLSRELTLAQVAIADQPRLESQMDELEQLRIKVASLESEKQNRELEALERERSFIRSSTSSENGLSNDESMNLGFEESASVSQGSITTFEELRSQFLENNAQVAEHKNLIDKETSVAVENASLGESSAVGGSEELVALRNALEHLKIKSEKEKAELLEKVNAQQVELDQLRNAGSTSESKLKHTSALEKQLSKLIATHRQLLRNFTNLQTTVTESKNMLLLRDEKIARLEGSLRAKDLTLKTQQERNALRIEELNLEHQRSLQSLELDLEKTKKLLRALSERSFEPPSQSWFSPMTTSTANISSSSSSSLEATTAASEGNNHHLEERQETGGESQEKVTSENAVIDGDASSSSITHAPRIVKPLKGGSQKRFR